MSSRPTHSGDGAPPVYNGRYELSHQIARGGTAQVYLARDQLLDRPVALKVLFPELSSDSSFVERFRREAQAAANLSHPNIVPVFDWGESERTYFIVMEYVDGEALSALIKAEAPLAPLRAASIASDIARALSYAHRHGVVHRDIKPGNVLLTRDGQVKVTDFGIARAVGTDDNVTQTGLVMGTATYFSPEQAQGLGVDGRSDVYSLGVVLYEMVTGKAPFAADTPVAIAYKHVSETPVRPRELEPRVPEALEAIILRAMAKRQADRYATAEDMQADLQRFAQGAPVLAGAGAMVGGAALGAAATQMMAPAAASTSVLPGLAGGAATTQVEHVTETGETPVPEMPRRRWIPWVVAGVLLLVALGLLVYYGGRQLGYFGGTADVRVPSVVGSTLHEAETALHHKGLKYSLSPEHSSRPKNTVLGANPQGGTVVAPGTRVTLYYSAGLKVVQVPSEYGVPRSAAESRLGSLGFRVQAIPVRPTNPNQTLGIVIRQSPIAGTYEPPGSTVKIYYVSGKQLVKVPTGVANQSLSSVQTAILNAGLKLGPTTQGFSSTVANGNVITTNPAPGSSVPYGTPITIVVSQGPGAKVPDVVGDQAPVAEQKIRARGLVPAEATEPGPASQINQVISQNPTGGTQVASGSTVTIIVDSGPSNSTTSTTTTTTTTPGGGGPPGGPPAAKTDRPRGR